MSKDTIERETLRLLKENPGTARSLAGQIKTSRKTMSSVLQKMRMAGLVTCTMHVWHAVPGAARRQP